MQPASLPFAAAGTIYTAPVGTQRGESGWKLIGHTSEDGVTVTEPFTSNDHTMQVWREPIYYGGKVIALQDRINKASRDYYSSIPQRWMTGMPPPGGYEIKTASQEALDLYFGKTATAALNERSKLMGLTKEHEYKDSDGDIITVSKHAEDGHVAHIATSGDSDENYGAYVRAADTVPLALNVLGFDRPSAELYATGPTEYNGKSANTAIPSSQGQRDANVALAIDYLRGADIYDQRVAERKAAEEAKAAWVAEREARLEAKEVARTKLAELVDLVAGGGVTRTRADALQIAVADYKKAVDAVGAASDL